MKEICLKEKCTACTACYSICSRGAIEMKADQAGYLYPHVDSVKCIDCNACVKVCPVNNPLLLKDPTHSIAAYSKNMADRQSSASGGVASVITQYILKNKGIVYGCVQENAAHIGHQRIEDLLLAEKLKGSKYVHSYIEDNYCRVKEDLKKGKLVLFVGTPCQVAGLKSFLRKDYENLFLVDLCCHGVPSQQFLFENIDYIRKYKEIPDIEHLQVSFRKKKLIKIWSILNPNLISQEIKYGLFLYSGDQLVYEKYTPNDYYISGFLSGLFFRPNCFTCPYARRERVSDITLADHWGMGKSENPEMKVHKGLSTILINTPKGYDLFRSIKDCIVFEERSWKESIDGNGQFKQAFEKPENYNDFQKDYLSIGYVEACKKHLSEYKRKQRIIKVKNKIANIPFVRSIYHSLKKVKHDFIHERNL